MAPIVEICVDSLESARNAKLGGADRLELCSALSLGGLTPSLGLLSAVKQLFTSNVQNNDENPANMPVFVMIRPREGDFVYDQDELEVMEKDIFALKEGGADGFVFGALRDDKTVDPEACGRLLRAAHPLPCTFHRAFDVTSDPFKSLEEIVHLGFRRLLTSGQRNTALEGTELIARLLVQAGDRLKIMAGAGVTEVNAPVIVRSTGVREIHGSASIERPTASVNLVKMGSGPEVSRKRVTSTDLVSLIVRSVSTL